MDIRATRARTAQSAENRRATPATGAREFARALMRALAKRPRSIAPKFFYDEVGQGLFERICALDEYYLTRAEISILQEHASRIAALFGPHADLVEFGAASASKARILLDAAARPARYLPLDLSFAQSDPTARRCWMATTITASPSGAGCQLSYEAQFDGGAIQGPMGEIVTQKAGEEIEASLGKLKAMAG